MHNLNYEELLSDSAYKEEHRLQMVTWSESNNCEIFINKFN